MLAARSLNSLRLQEAAEPGERPSEGERRAVLHRTAIRSAGQPGAARPRPVRPAARPQTDGAGMRSAAAVSRQRRTGAGRAVASGPAQPDATRPRFLAAAPPSYYYRRLRQPVRQPHQLIGAAAKDDRPLTEPPPLLTLLTSIDSDWKLNLIYVCWCG